MELESRAVQILFNHTFFGTREHELNGNLVGAAGEVGQLGDSKVVGVGHADSLVLQTEHKDDGIGISEALAIPHAEYKGIVVQIHTVIQLVKFHLMLVDDIRADGDIAEGAAFAASAFQIEIASEVRGPFDGQAGDGDESLVWAGHVVDGQTEIEVFCITDEACREVGDGFGLFVGSGFIGLVHETVLGVNHIAKGEFVPIEALLLESGLQGEAHIEFTGDFQLIGVDETGRVGVYHPLPLMVPQEQNADTSGDLVEMLVIRSGIGDVGTVNVRPLVAEMSRETRADIGACKGRIQV